MRLFAYSSGIKLVSAKDKVDIEALRTSVNLLSKLDITHTANRVSITAQKSVTFNGGGSYTVWNAAGIKSGTTGAHVAHAAAHSLPPGRSEAVVMPPMARVTQTDFHEQFRAVHPATGQPIADMPYQVVLTSGQSFSGRTDANGQTSVIATNDPHGVKLYWGGPLSDGQANNNDMNEEGC